MLRPLQELNCLLIKPVGPRCNLRCEYCFYLEKEPMFDSLATMNDEVLEATIKGALERGNQSFSFIWQGGEPLLAGIDFFRKAVALQKKYGAERSVSNALQTNGTLITEEWADFFVENDFLVGVSLDGPEHIHDTYRYDVSGNSSWKTVFEKAKLCLEKNVSINILSCVTSTSVTAAIELYEFYKKEGFQYLQFIPVVERDEKGQTTEFSVGAKAYGQFLRTLFDHWYADFKDGQPQMSIRLFDTLFFALMGQTAPECGMQKTCGSYLTVEHTGDMYPCDFFVEPVHGRGNVMTHPPHDVINSKLQRLFGGAKERVEDTCTSCQWQNLCHGGCLKDRRNNPQDGKMNYFCRAMKDFYPHVIPKLEELTKAWQG